MPNGTDNIPIFDEVMGGASAQQKQSSIVPSFDEVMGTSKKKDGTESSSNGSQSSGMGSNSPSLPSNSPQQSQPTQPKYVVHVDGTTTPYNYHIASIDNSIQNNQQNSSDATNIQKPVVAPSASDIAAKKASVKADNETAIDNTVKKIVAQKGEGGATGVNSTLEKQKLQNQLQNGEVSVGYDKDGNLGLKQQDVGGITGFVGSFMKIRDDANKEAADADLFTNGLSNTERIAFLKNKQQEESASPFIDTKQSFGSTVGKLTGSLEQPLENLGKGAIAGAATVAAAPATMGASLEGLPLALGIAMGNKDAFNMGYSSEVQRAFGAIKKANPNISDIDAMNEAEKQGNVGGSVGLATNIALMGGSVEGGGSIAKKAISDGAKDIIGKAVAGTAKMAVIPAVGQAATEEAGNLNGVKTSQSDVLNDAVQSFKNNLTPAVVLHLIGASAAGLTQLPKSVENSLKLAATELDPEQIKSTLEGGEKTGFYPAGTAELVTHDINNFKEATDKIPSEIPDEKKAEIAPLIQNKQSLIEEQKTKDSSFKDSYQEKIDNVDNQIKQIINKPTEEDVNNNSSQLNTTDNGKSSQEANASSEGRQEVNQKEEIAPNNNDAVSSSKSSDAKKVYREVNKIDDPTDAKSAALQYIAGGGKIHPDSINDITGTTESAKLNTGAKDKSSSEVKNRDYVDKNAPLIDETTHKIWDNLPEHLQDKMSTQDIKNELQDVVKNHNKRLSAANEYVDKYGLENNLTKQEQDFYDQHYPKENGSLEKWLEDESGKTYENDEHFSKDNDINHLIDNYESDNKKENTKSTTTDKETSSIPTSEGNSPIENKGFEEEPAIDKIEPDNTFRTLDYGEHKGEEESTEKQNQIKDDIINDKPLGKTGEKFSDFVNRVVPAFKDLIDKEPNNTTVVTHSSVIKALDVWEDMGRPDVESMTDKQKQKFAEKYVKEDIEKEGGVSTFKGEGDNVIHAVRHGETEDNKMSEFREDNTKLTPKGEGQAAKAGQELNKITGGDVPKIISSDLPRAIHTSNIISEQLGKESEASKEEATPKNDKATLTVEKEEPKPASIEDGTTGIKNDITEMRRKELGMKESEKTIKKAFGTTWDEAKDKIDKGYSPKDLIEELKKKPRPINDVESAILLHEQNTKEMEMLDTNKVINEASEKGDTQGVEEAQVRRARLKDELQDIYDVDKASGRELGRGLAARNMMTDRKYNLVNMMAEKRAENGGVPLTEEQEKNVEALHQKIKETQQAYDDYVKQAEEEIKGLQEKILGKKVINRKTAAEKLRDIADKIDKATKGQTYSSIVPITPKMITNSMRLIATGLEKGEELLDLIKKAVAQIKGEHPEIDENKLTKAINKEVIDAGITSNAVDRSKVKDLSAIVTDRKALKLKADAERAKNDYELSLKKDSDKNLSAGAKAQNIFTKWSRAFKLSNPITMGKLAVAAITRMTTTPLEDIAGSLIHPLIPKISKGAIGEGGTLHVKELANSYKTGILEGMKDSAKLLSKEGKGKTDIDVVFGKHADLPPEAIDFFGTLHSATKAPVKRFIFERSLQKRLRMSIANGIDVSDPLVQTRIAIDSYKDATRAIFMQDNAVSKGWQKMTTYLDTPDAKTGKAPSKGTATALKWLVPFVKVPTNISAEIGTNVYGVPVGVAKIVHSMFNGGMENLSADEKDVIMRNLKKGSLGAAALTLGYMNPKVFGGFYQPGEKRKDNDAEVGGVKLGDIKIPAWFFESPIFQAMQIGSTVRRVKDKMVHGEENGVGEGVWAGALGMAEHIPMVESPLELSKMWKSPTDRTQYLGQMAKSTIDPALLNYVAMTTDPADKREIGQRLVDPKSGTRKPSTIAESVASGLPVLRETVPTKKRQGSFGGAGASGGY